MAQRGIGYPNGQGFDYTGNQNANFGVYTAPVYPQQQQQQQQAQPAQCTHPEKKIYTAQKGANAGKQFEKCVACGKFIKWIWGQPQQQQQYQVPTGPHPEPAPVPNLFMQQQQQQPTPQPEPVVILKREKYQHLHNISEHLRVLSKSVQILNTLLFKVASNCASKASVSGSELMIDEDEELDEEETQLVVTGSSANKSSKQG
jgi:hypothetical protein